VLFGVLFIALASASLAAQQEAATSGPWISLFNGKNLDGWKAKIAGYDLGENFGDTFRVEDGLIKVRYDKYDKFNERFGHLFYKDKFSHYRLRVEYRFIGDKQCPGAEKITWAYRNSGVMIHCQAPETMRKDQPFPVCIEVQFLGGNGKDERPTGNLCTPGTHVVMNGALFTPHCVNSRSKTYHGDQWVTVEAEVFGNTRISHIVNGETVMTYEQPQLDDSDADAKRLIKGGDKMVREGYIALQAESHPIDFRKVEILPMK
jgi:hypothetical protein